jgi:hypothetical protein
VKFLFLIVKFPVVVVSVQKGIITLMKTRLLTKCYVKWVDYFLERVVIL